MTSIEGGKVDRAEKLLGIAVIVLVLGDRYGVDATTVQRVRWRSCARVAEWFGRQALSAESAYREAVAP